jgi:hypothetical protein
MSKTYQLVKLLQQRSINPNDPHGYVAGYLHAVLERFEKEYKSAEVILDEEIAHITKLNQEVA